MDETLIDWTFPNFITVSTMAILMLAIVALGIYGYKSKLQMDNDA